MPQLFFSWYFVEEDGSSTTTAEGRKREKHSTTLLYCPDIRMYGSNYRKQITSSTTPPPNKRHTSGTCPPCFAETLPSELNT